MAFQQPVPRPATHVRQQSEQQITASPARKRTLEESQEWILFSPAQQGQQSQASESMRTATQPSDCGSLETHVQSQPAVTDEHSAVDVAVEDEHGEDQTELDSLDDGLHAFHHPFSASSGRLDMSGGAVLPRHDGFGAFPSSGGLQEQLWQFERHNPHRRRLSSRRRSSVHRQLAALGEDGDVSMEVERTARIEKWRLEQSHAVLEEIEKETKRRRRRISRMSGTANNLSSTTHIQQLLEPTDASSIPSQMSNTTATATDAQPNESLWQKITRKVIQDLIGLDDSTLAVILGESLAEDVSPTPRQTSPLAAAASRESRVAFHDSANSWEVRLIDRIARELGTLVNCLSTHDNAFSTYMQAQGELDYAGLGIPSHDFSARQQPSLRQQRRQQQQQQNSSQPQPSSLQVPHQDSIFLPTLNTAHLSTSDAPDSSLWGIEEEPTQETAETERRRQQQQEYWERDLDVNVIFTYLRNFFSGSNNLQLPQSLSLQNRTSPQFGPLPASWATSSAAVQTQSPAQQESSRRRAEAIRRQHPLVSHAAQQVRRRHHESLLRRQLAQRQRAGMGDSSGCASQSTRRSRHSRSASSRPFWDFGGSVGSVGSGAVLSSAVGGWGEV